MKQEHENQHDHRLERWATYRRRNGRADSTDLTREVMRRIAAMDSTEHAPRRKPPRLKRLALTSACAATGIGKVLVILHLSI